MPVVSITRLRLRSWRFFPGFLWYAIRSNMQARRAQGNRGVKVLRERANIFWTATVWDSESHVKRFMISGAHGRVMPKLLNWCDEASLVHWMQELDSLPSWQDAHRRMMAEGRLSKVRHPSAAHERFAFPAPRSGR